ncbi:uncharacterized protein LOC134197217 isoform X2 [Corticium candelabrum]|uniref:uncharacterized protein LOC134197217 isoform X2 n=1 Tax=Corticium candelabrum TaxID=121492 RepID=UPI002E267340|nr:uncharacterized protein LOC134197217 isoform X2 [Corticium candelabrum]
MCVVTQMENRKHYRPAPADAAALNNSNKRLSLQQGKLSSALLLPQPLVQFARSETKLSQTQESLRNYELPQHVVDAIAREEEDKSRSLMVLEREDVLKHPTVGTDDSTASPRRAQPQQHQLSAYSAVVAPFDHQLALSDIEDIEQQNKTDVTIIKATDTEPRIARHSILQAHSVKVIRHMPRSETTRSVAAHQGAVKDDVLVTLSDIEEPINQQMSQTVHQTARSVNDMKDDLGVEDVELELADSDDLYYKMEQSVRKEVGWKQGDNTTTKSSSRGDTKAATKKKRPKGRVVPSRYMSSAQTYPEKRSLAQHKTAIAAKVKSLRSPKSHTQHQSQMEFHSRSHIGHESRIQTPANFSNAVNKSNWMSTPFLSHHQAGLRGRSSIPVPDVSYIAKSDDHMDVSVGDRSDLFAMGQTFARQVNTSHTSHAGAAMRSKGERQERGKEKSSSVSQFSQKDLDLLRCRMHQWSYLATMADKALYEQEQDAMKQLYAVWSETEALRNRLHTLSLNLQEAKQNEALDCALDEQLKGLAPIMQIINRLEPQFSRLAHGLDTTRHQYPTKGIQLPKKPEKLLASMNRSEVVLGDMMLSIRQQQQQAASLSQTIRALENALQVESQEMQRCQEYLSACESLQTQETSMKIHKIQTNAEETGV